MLIPGFLTFLVIFLLLEGLFSEQSQDDSKVDNRLLHDPALAYHLDWNAIRDGKFLAYLYVKKVNAVVRYQTLAGVDYEQAQSAIEHLLAHPELLPEIPLKRRPAIPDAEDKRLHNLIASGDLSEAALLYANLVDVDQFTAQQVIERMEREQYVESIQDRNVQRLLLDNDETKAIAILQKRYGLTQDEAIHAIDNLNDNFSPQRHEGHRENNE